MHTNVERNFVWHLSVHMVSTRKTKYRANTLCMHYNNLATTPLSSHKIKSHNCTKLESLGLFENISGPRLIGQLVPHHHRGLQAGDHLTLGILSRRSER